ncbi:MAG: amphi-Trp domain-containing protein [bacterium]|nr:amphi-Trp domain-containing protein [bacterium]
MSSNKTREFEYVTLVDKQSIVTYLETLAEGFKSGNLTLKSPESELLLDPDGLLKLEIAAKNKSGRSKISIKVSWKNQPRVEINKDRLSLSVSPKED